MFRNGRKTDMPQDGAQSSVAEGKGSWFKENKRSIVAVGLIVIMAFVMRFIFSFGVSAGSDFALSGGVLASEHLHTITQIMNGGSFFGVDGSLSYPFGSVNSNPVLIDAILAGIAMIGTALGMSAVKAASLTLATFSLACGTLAVIPMFLLGKEVIGTRKAGFVAAIFLAFCPVVITQTVFSNGTETGWILLLFIILSLMVFKGLKAINTSTKTDEPFKSVLAANKPAIKLAAISGLILALIVLSTSDFRAIVIMLILAMGIMTVAGRFMYRDTRQVVLFFSIIVLIGMAVAAAYYIPAKLWNEILSGILILSLLAVLLCFTFSLLQRKAWVVTVPVYLIGVIVAFVLLSAFAPEFYDVIVHGNTPLAACVDSLADGTLSVSFISTAFGVVSMWLGIFVIGVLIWKLPKNISSVRYQFLVIFMFFSALMTFQSQELATVFSPVFALGFAYVVMWFFDNVDFRTYFLSIKNAGFKHAWRKILRPIPFGSILIIGVLLCVPLGMYAIDASVSNNEKGDFDGLNLGAIGYYVKTNTDWKTGPVLSSYSDVDKEGAMVTWMEYANDAATLGKFNVITDSEGNGAEAVSNILLSDAVDGSSNAAMMIYLLTYTGMTDDVKAKLVANGMTEGDYNTFKDIMQNPSKFRGDVVTDATKYGALTSGVSDDNVRFIYGSEFLTEKYSAFKISGMYSDIAGIAGKNISYFLVDGSMFPMYYGYSSLFSTMAYANGYVLSDNYGTVPQFLVLGNYTYYTGIYEYTDAMYNTLLWRTYIGMSPAEAGLDSAYTYFDKLMLSDGQYKAHPGYGLSNFTVDYEHWYVMYNADDEAKLSSDGWEKTPYLEAVAKQNSDGGLINYLSGLPVVMKYVPNSSGNAVSGTVTNYGGATSIEGIRVSVVDSEGTVRSTAYTDADGKYEILVTGKDPKLKFFSGSQNLADGSLIKTVDYSTVSGVLDIEIEVETTINGKFVDSNNDTVDMTGANLVLRGKVSKEEYILRPLATPGFTFADVVPDVYEVSLKSADEKISYVTDKTITVSPGENKGITVTLDYQKTTISVKDDSRAPLDSVEFAVVDATTGTIVKSGLTTDAKGEKEIDLVPGSYYCTFTGNYVASSAPFTVTTSSSSATVIAHAAPPVDFNFTAPNKYKMATIYSTGYQTAVLTSDTGVASVKLPTGIGAGAVYTAYLNNGTQGYIFTSDAPGTKIDATMKVTGTMKNSSDEAVSGTIVFISGAKQIPVSVASDGTYSVYLTGDEYTVYANNGFEVSIKKITPTADMVNDIKLGEGTQVSGSATWGTNSNGMQFVPIDVSNITGCDGCAFTVTTDSSGAYSFYIPKDATCDLNARLTDSGSYYYGTTTEKAYTKSVTGQSGTVSAFKANVDDIKVTNNFGKTIKVNSVTIASGENKNIPVTGSWTVEVDDSTAEFYSKKTLYNRPGMGDYPIPSTFFDGETKYYQYTVTGLASGDTVSVKSTNDGTVGKTYSSENKYYLEYTTETEKKVFVFTVTNTDSTRIGYATATVNDEAIHDVPVTVSEAATVKGYVGYNGTGTMTLTYDAGSFEFDITSGRYSILVPIDKAITLDASIKNESASETYTYTGSVSIAASTLAVGTTNVYNMAVTSATSEGTDKIWAPSMTIPLNGMSGEGIAQIDFSVVFENHNDTHTEMTYSLSGGSSWSNIRFFSDAGRTNEISTITFTDGETVYATGTIIKSNVAYGDENLSVILKDPSGETVCTATFTDETNWSKTTKNVTKVNTTSNSMGDSEYMYAIEIVNDDNFTKKFVLSPATIDTDKWFITYVNGKDIVAHDAGLGNGTVYVDGYTTATVFVKITYKSGDQAPEMPTEINIVITATDLAGTACELTTDTADTVTVSGNNATAKSTTSDSTVSIDSNGASGRNVVDKRSDMPAYDWVLIALAVAALFLLIWAASKRGVFSRKK